MQGWLPDSGEKKGNGGKGNGGKGNGGRGNGGHGNGHRKGERSSRDYVHVLPDGEVTYGSPTVRYETPRRGARRRLFGQDEMEARRQDAVQRNPRFQAERQRRLSRFQRDMERRFGLRGIVAGEHRPQFDQALGMYEDLLVQEFHDAGMYAESA